MIKYRSYVVIFKSVWDEKAFIARGGWRRDCSTSNGVTRHEAACLSGRLVRFNYENALISFVFLILIKTEVATVSVQYSKKKN